MSRCVQGLNHRIKNFELIRFSHMTFVALPIARNNWTHTALLAGFCCHVWLRYKVSTRVVFIWPLIKSLIVSHCGLFSLHFSSLPLHCTVCRISHNSIQLPAHNLLGGWCDEQLAVFYLKSQNISPLFLTFVQFLTVLRTSDPLLPSLSSLHDVLYCSETHICR
jgi:hypothetical protein